MQYMTLRLVLPSTGSPVHVALHASGYKRSSQSTWSSAASSDKISSVRQTCRAKNSLRFTNSSTFTGWAGKRLWQEILSWHFPHSYGASHHRTRWEMSGARAATNVPSSLRPILNGVGSAFKSLSSRLVPSGLSVWTGVTSMPPLLQIPPAMAVIVFALWGLGPTFQALRKSILKSDDKWDDSQTKRVVMNYIRPALVWLNVIIICRGLDSVSLSSVSSQAVKQRFVDFSRALTTVLAFASITGSFTQQLQRAWAEGAGEEASKNVGFQFIGNSVYALVWVAAVFLFMELLGFSTQKWITAGGFGTVFLTLAAREIVTNFLSAIMLHTTRPFKMNDWIKTKIDSQEISGVIERVGWWSPTIVRGEDREAVHIPNHKFSVSIVRNLSQKTHWRVKARFGISHVDVGKITDIVADMRKIIAKDPQVEQQRLHRRVFFDDVSFENQALMIMVSCFVKTPHYEEFLRVKERILLDLLRVIKYHNARLATPVRTIQRSFDDVDRQAPYRNVGGREEVVRRPFLLLDGSSSGSDHESEYTPKVDAASRAAAVSVSVSAVVAEEEVSPAEATPQQPKLTPDVAAPSSPEITPPRPSQEPAVTPAAKVRSSRTAEGKPMAENGAATVKSPTLMDPTPKMTNAGAAVVGKMDSPKQGAVTVERVETSASKSSENVETSKTSTAMSKKSVDTSENSHSGSGARSSTDWDSTSESSGGKLQTSDDVVSSSSVSAVEPTKAGPVVASPSDPTDPWADNAPVTDAVSSPWPFDTTVGGVKEDPWGSDTVGNPSSESFIPDATRRRQQQQEEEADGVGSALVDVDKVEREGEATGTMDGTQDGLRISEQSSVQKKKKRRKNIEATTPSTGKTDPLPSFAKGDDSEKKEGLRGSSSVGRDKGARGGGGGGNGGGSREGRGGESGKQKGDVPHARADLRGLAGDSKGLTVEKKRAERDEGGLDIGSSPSRASSTVASSSRKFTSGGSLSHNTISEPTTEQFLVLSVDSPPYKIPLEDLPSSQTLSRRSSGERPPVPDVPNLPDLSTVVGGGSCGRVCGGRAVFQQQESAE